MSQQELSEKAWARKGQGLPSTATISRHHITLDVSILVLERQWIAERGAVIQFGLAYLSPQYGRDYLCCSYIAIAIIDLVRAAAAADGLLAARASDREADADDHEQVLLKCLHRYDCPVAVMGRAHAPVAEKCSALAWAWYIMMACIRGLVSFCCSFASMTTDMGTELGFSHFRTFSIHSLLPDWVPGVEGQDLGFDAGVAGPVAALGQMVLAICRASVSWTSAFLYLDFSTSSAISPKRLTSRSSTGNSIPSKWPLSRRCSPSVASARCTQ